MSLRITRQYHLARDEPQRWKVISLHPSYHGATAAALSMTGRWDISRDYEPYLFGGRKIAAPIAFRGPFKDLDDESLAQRAADALEAAIQSEGPDTVAAFIVEPIALSTGMAVPPIQYWSRVREICDRFGVLLITDEVITGVGRTGAFLGTGSCERSSGPDELGERPGRRVCATRSDVDQRQDSREHPRKGQTDGRSSHL